MYFPSLQDYRALSGTTEETVHSDADLDAVQRMFDLLFALCDSLTSAFQIVVLEHANLPDGRFQDALVEPPWLLGVSLERVYQLGMECCRRIGEITGANRPCGPPSGVETPPPWRS